MFPFRLYVITDRNRCGGRALTAALVEATQAGVRGIQIREKDMPPKTLIPLVEEIMAATAPCAPYILINDRADIARVTGAAGTHIPESGIPADRLRTILPDGSLIGCSTHSLESAMRAERAGADFITFGPVYATPSKAAFGPPQGLDALRRITASIHIPVFALGGVSPERVPECLDAGACGVGVIGAVLAAENISDAVRAFSETLGEL
jgi:thiamine-phosphate pyrophosphorylase